MGDPLKTGFTRVFMIEGRARGDREPSYESSTRMMGVDYAFGDVEDIKVPDPDNYDKFLVVGQVRGEEERPSTSLQGRYAVDVRSELLRLAKIGCSVDVQLHMGACTTPSIFNEFSKAIVLEDVLISNYGTDELGALSPDERAVVNETADISAAKIYEVLPVGASEVAGDLVLAEVVDVVIADSLTCGECDVYSDGCQKIFALMLGGGGSPGALPDVVFSLNQGGNWYSHDVDGAGDADILTAIAVVAGYVVVTDQTRVSHLYADVDEFDETQDPAFAEVTANYVGAPNDMWSLGPRAFIVGEDGYIYLLSDPTGGPTVLDTGAASGGDDLNAVHAIDAENAVAVGNSGAVVYTTNGALWTAATSRPLGVGEHLRCVWMRSKTEWWVGSDTGQIFYTIDAGVNWTEKTFAGSGAGVVWDLQFPTDSVGWFAHATATDVGRMFRSYDGGYSWQAIPEGTAIFPASDRITALYGCPFDVNVAVGVGLADDATDGIIVMAT